VYPVLVHALAAIASPAPPPGRRAAAGRSAPGYLLATEVPAHWYPLWRRRARSAVRAVAGRLGTGVDHTLQREGNMTYFDVSQESSNSRSSGEWVIRTVPPFMVSTTRCSPTQHSPVERMENRSPTPARKAGKQVSGSVPRFR
jgi:hypothetical protein